jgi:hypothetical protein
MPDVRERIREQNEDAILLDPPCLDSAIVGMTHDGRVVYDRARLVDAFVKDAPGMSHEDAEEHVCHNTERALPYMGEHAPVLLVVFE